jgi:hypothetical protein
METNAKVPPVAPVPEPIQPQTKPEAPPAQAQEASQAVQDVPAWVSQPTDYRLVIDKNPVNGQFVYRTVDRFTGKTVAEFPSEDIAKLRDSSDYKVGSVFSGKV